MAPDTAHDRYPRAIAAVQAFFGRYYGDNVTTSDDADEEATIFHLGGPKRAVVVTADFLELTVAEISEKLAAWNVAHLSRTLERRCRLKITSEGPEEERD